VPQLWEFDGVLLAKIPRRHILELVGQRNPPGALAFSFRSNELNLIVGVTKVMRKVIQHFKV
jgi:hypothetical protein